MAGSFVPLPLGLWQSVHIDDLRRSKDMVSDMTALQNLTISQMFCEHSAKTKGELRAGVGTGRAECAPRLVLVELLPGTTYLLTFLAQHLFF